MECEITLKLKNFIINNKIIFSVHQKIIFSSIFIWDITNVSTLVYIIHVLVCFYYVEKLLKGLKLIF